MIRDDFESLESFESIGLCAQQKYHRLCMIHRCNSLFAELQVAKTREQVIHAINKIDAVTLHSSAVHKN